MTKTIYYLPGYGGKLGTGLGEGLLGRGFNVTGRETTGEFKNIPFEQQVDTVADDLRNHFWQDDAFVVANSFGAYLFLHAQAQMEPYIGHVLLLSPIVGEFSNQDTGMNFMPPLPERLRELARSGAFKAPKRCDIHVGEQDWQSNPVNVTEFGQLVGIKVIIAPGAGHLLGKHYVGALLDRWLG